MSKSCPATIESEITGSNILAQHLFLGASINNFSTNLGWGGSPSTLNVELINDQGSAGKCNILNNPNLDIFQIKNFSQYDIDNHYHDCVGDSCYCDENGNPYLPEGSDGAPPSKERRIPGKVYYKFNPPPGSPSDKFKDLVAKYWLKHDPGFFATGTMLDPTGKYAPRIISDNLGNKKILPYRYNIIGSPVLFRYGYFTFGGVVSSWDATINGIAVKDLDTNSIDAFKTPITYRVTINSFDSILEQCKVILNDYTGSVFCSFGSDLTSSYGGPTNYTGSKGTYNGLLKFGNIPNIFNIYGFLESYGFGASEKNDQGIPLAYVLNSLSLLTSVSQQPSQTLTQALGPKAPFSPFGRIILPAMLTDAIDTRDEFYGNPTYANFGNNSFGLINPTLDSNSVPRVMFSLDLSEIPLPPMDVRINGDNLSVMDIIRRACEITGRDFFTTMVRKNGINFIKIKTVNRTVTIPPNIIETTVKQISNSGIPVTQSSFGQNDNRATPRALLIGGKQRRLYQVKSLLLGYSNSHLVFHPVLNKFIDYYRFGKTSEKKDQDLAIIPKEEKFVDSIRIPLNYSTRNIDMCTMVNGQIVTNLWAKEQKIAGLGAEDLIDPGFSDSPVGGQLYPTLGNYNPAAVFSMEAKKEDKENPRYLPLYLYSISPFFGYANDVKVPKNNDVYSNRFIRPVYFDTVTGQIVVLFRSSELPVLSIGRMPSLFKNRPSSYNNRFGNWPLDTQGMRGDRQPANGNFPTSETEPPQQPDNKASPTPSPTASGGSDPFSGSLFTDDISFSIKESEFRAASAGFDNYLMYCLSKIDMTKPDLFVMLIKAYQEMRKPIWTTPEMSTIDATGPVGGAGGMSEGASAGSSNMASMVPGIPKGNTDILFSDILNINFNLIINYEFLEDLRIICSFIKKLADEYYGQQYAVALPSVMVYRDKQYADIQIPIGADTVGVYEGSGKLYYSYDIVDSAWEEFGNYIDDNIIVGSPNYYTFTDEQGKISPIIGYNATPIKDYVTELWCKKNPDDLKSAFQNVNLPYPRYSGTENFKRNCAYIRSNYELSSIYRYFSCDKFITPSINLSNIGSDDYILLSLNDKGREDPYGNRLLYSSGNDPCSQAGVSVAKESEGVQTQKLYIKTTCENRIAFLDPFNLKNPRAIIKSPGIDIANSSTSYKDDPSNSIISNVAAEDFAYIEYLKTRDQKEKDKIYEDIGKTIRGFNYNRDMILSPETIEDMKTFGLLGPNENDIDALVNKLNNPDKKIKGETQLNYISYILKKLIVSITSDGYLLQPPNVDNQSKTHEKINPKRANPIFAAIPLMDNTTCYGPWTNYPYLSDQTVLFPGIKDTSNIIEQLISDIDIEKKDEWVPWEYGGMAFLDKAILYELNNKISYQTRLDSGDITIAGPPVFSMGGNLILKKIDEDINIPIKKYWMNMEYNTLAFAPAYSALNNYAGLAISDMSLSVSSNSITTRYGFRTYSAKRGLFSKENSDRIKLLATQRISMAKKIQDIQSSLSESVRKQISSLFQNRAGKGQDISSLKSRLFGTSPATTIVGEARGYLPLGEYIDYVNSIQYNTDDLQNQKYILYNKVRYDSSIGQYETREAMNELGFGYSSKAGMSLDGLYSPISFYPTLKQGTYPISSRFITTIDQQQKLFCPVCDNTHVVKISKKDYPCPVCQKPKLFPIEQSSGTTTNTTETSSEPTINFITLNPIVMPTGELRNINAQPRESGERARHNISFIARQESPIRDRNCALNHNLTTYKDNSTEPNPDWTNIDLSYKEDFDKNILLNQRFFAHRGPMMLHGWGYDIDGYPIPNQADEPKEFDIDGRPKRFILTSSGTNDLTKDGAFLPSSTDQLGDIIGKGWERDGGEWKKTKSNKFYLNWAERPDLWPIGPIDLRWDNENKIWVGGGGGGCNNAEPPYIVASGTDSSLLASFASLSSSKNKKCSYKMVYSILEQDIKKPEGVLETYPCRAFLDDLEYSLNPLPENIRRLIYIVDRTGYTAPRGAKILVRYNTDTGFYEPISKQQYIVFGIIDGSSSATIELDYVPGYKSGDNNYKLSINYKNPLGLQATTKAIGMFMYNNQFWNLISIK